jgi:two-component system nitrate/nitrite response regulator NarL
MTAQPIPMPEAQLPIAVMVVDDHPTMLWGLSRLVEAQAGGMRLAASASSCEEALAMVAQAAPDVIVLDLDLGGRCSIEIMAQLQQRPGTRVLVLTAERDPHKLDQAVLAGAQGVLRKDAPAQQVVQAIERVHRGEMLVDVATLGRLLNELRAPAKADPEALKQSQLTPKERKIIDAVLHCEGASNKALADRLFITEHTLRNYLSSIYQKLELSNRLELYIYAGKHQLTMR